MAARSRGRGTSSVKEARRPPARSGRITTRARAQTKLLLLGSAVSVQDISPQYAALEGCEVFRVSDGEKLRRDVKPRLDAANIKLLLVSIGTPERGKDFARETGFPQENLLADPENACYDTLGFYKGAQRTFFHPATPFSMRDRIMNGSTKDLQEILSRWKPWIPPKLDQGLQQGGLLCFDGTQSVFSHKDQATGAHADFDDAVASLMDDRDT